MRRWNWGLIVALGAALAVDCVIGAAILWVAL